MRVDSAQEQDGGDDAAAVHGGFAGPTPAMPDHILRFEDVADAQAFYDRGLGPDGAQLLQAPGKELVIQDRKFVQRLFMTGISKFTLRIACDMKFMPPGATGAKNRNACTSSYVSAVFKAFVEQHPRVAVLDATDGSLLLRNCPEDVGGQDRMHNECMTAVRLTLRRRECT